MRHINFFPGAQNGGFWVGAKKFMLKKFMCFFLSLSLTPREGPAPNDPTHVMTHTTEFFIPRIEIGAACYRTEKAQIRKSGGESAGKSAGGSAERNWIARGTAGNSVAPLFS